MATPLIEVNHLSKRYRGSQHYSLHDLSLQVDAGEVYGFLGANGAGKSTTIRLLMNFLRPTSGDAQICSLDTQKQSVLVKQSVGYLAGEIALYNKMTGRELLATFARLQPVDPEFLAKLVTRFEVDLDKPIGQLSKGNRQKVGILQAVMHQPKVLILDEPTSGLDPLMQEAFYDLMKEVSSAGAAVFVSSHNLAEVQRMCSRVGIIRQGKLITEKSVSEMLASNLQRFSITFASTVPEGLANVPGTRLIGTKESVASVEVTGNLEGLLKFLAKHSVVRLQSEQTDLEQEFLHYYEEDA